MAKTMGGAKKLEVGKHFGAGTEVSGQTVGGKAGRGRTGKPFGHEHRKTEGLINASALDYSAGIPNIHGKHKK